MLLVVWRTVVASMVLISGMAAQIVHLSFWLPQQPFSNLSADQEAAVDSGLQLALDTVAKHAHNAPDGGGWKAYDLASRVKFSQHGDGPLVHVGFSSSGRQQSLLQGMLHEMQALYSRTAAGAMRDAGLHVDGITMTVPTLANDHSAVKPHHLVIGVLCFGALMLVQKKRMSNRQLAKLHDRQRRRRTEMVDGVDGQELGWAYHDDVCSDDDVPDDVLESQPLKGDDSRNVRRRSSA